MFIWEIFKYNFNCKLIVINMKINFLKMKELLSIWTNTIFNDMWLYSNNLF